MAGAHALSWAVGAYLPLSTTFPIFIGGLIKGYVDRKAHVTEESELSSGMLYSTGLVAGGSLMGVGIAIVAAFGDVIMKWENPNILDRLDLGAKLYPALKNGVGGDILCAVVFAVLCALLVRNAGKKLNA